MTIEEYQKLLRRRDDLRQTISREKGIGDVAMARIKKEFDCRSLPEAKKRLAEKEREVEKLDKQFEKLYSAFEDEYGD